MGRMSFLQISAILCLFGCTPADSPEPTIAEEPPNPVFTLLVMPDIQYMTLDPGPLDPLHEMMSWVLENHESMGIAMVLQEGDITHNNSTAEWQKANDEFSRIEGVVPYTLCVGNHDMEGEERDTTEFNAWFGMARLREQATFYASASETAADDHAHVFNAGGLNWMVLSLAYDPTDEAVAWGAELVANHPDYRVIVLTHAYLTPGASTGVVGVGIQEQIVDPNANVRFVLNGHYTGGNNAQRRRVRDDGSEVIELFVNYQTEPISGGGRMRQLQIDTETGTLDAMSCNAFGHCSTVDGDVFTMSNVPW